MRLVYKGIPFIYELTPGALLVRLGPWTARRVEALEVESVRLGSSMWNEHWTNIWPMRFVTIRRKSGWFKDFVINPPDGEEFVAEARRLFGLGGPAT
jgi:hypothetical protein